MAQGSEASMVRIAGAGFRLSLLLNAAACQLAQSRLEIHSIAKGISLFALTLKHVGQTLNATGMDRLPEATEKAWEIADQGQMVFIEIEHMLDKLKDTDAHDELRRFPLQERLKWCFRKQHVTYLLAQLESLKLGLIVMLRILQLGHLIKSCADDGNSSAPDDAIAQDKAEAQNMVIVRYWSAKRLDRLWDLVEQEALDAAKDPTSQMINSSYLPNTTSALRPLIDVTKGPNLTRLPVVTFGESDVGLSDIERSPKDMVHLSESAMIRLLSLWMPSLDSSRLLGAGRPAQKACPPRVEVPSDSEESDDLDFDGHGIRGYFLEGKTGDWRKPQSQAARQQAAERRKRYSSYQAHVDSDPESDEHVQRRNSRRSSPRVTDSSDESDQRSTSRRPSNGSSVISGGRVHSNSVSSRFPPHLNPDGKPAAYPCGSFPPPNPPNQAMPRSQPSPQPQPAPIYIPGSPPQPYKYHPTQEYGNTPRSMPIHQPSTSNTMPNPSPRDTPPVQFEPPWTRAPTYNGNMLQPRRHKSAYPLSSSSPEPSLRPSPPRSVQRSPSHSHRRTSREDPKERHKALTRDATRGLVGIGAIAGFMDALEAFSIL
ncbi:hypothetical protein NUU61_009237 [Penicillium alfredii]|uniref:Uncharacterized protein n=1 Tax=Penicillium alfredii TaxID=1506179 RepID=A0A9W9JWY8_9EURO|nr:uncharacterized protein NUU61_009237 [Penicillium alfredii]KAJ5084658.1 hypothetical protein NUU61_009237 [Penicillium alfredii]